MTNEKFHELYNNSDNKRILNRVARKFHLDLDDLEHAKNVALWKAWKTFKGGKFTTYLYRLMKFECIKLIKREGKRPPKTNISDLERIELNDLTKILSDKEQVVIRGKMENKTFVEISQEMSLTPERIRQLYQSALEKMRKECDVN